MPRTVLLFLESCHTENRPKEVKETRVALLVWAQVQEEQYMNRCLRFIKNTRKDPTRFSV